MMMAYVRMALEGDRERLGSLTRAVQHKIRKTEQLISCWPKVEYYSCIRRCVLSTSVMVSTTLRPCPF